MSLHQIPVQSNDVQSLLNQGFPLRHESWGDAVFIFQEPRTLLNEALYPAPVKSVFTKRLEIPRHLLLVSGEQLQDMNYILPTELINNGQWFKCVSKAEHGEYEKAKTITSADKIENKAIGVTSYLVPA